MMMDGGGDSGDGDGSGKGGGGDGDGVGGCADGGGGGAGYLSACLSCSSVCPVHQSIFLVLSVCPVRVTLLSECPGRF